MRLLRDTNREVLRPSSRHWHIAAISTALVVMLASFALVVCGCSSGGSGSDNGSSVSSSTASQESGSQSETASSQGKSDGSADSASPSSSLSLSSDQTASRSSSSASSSKSGVKADSRSFDAQGNVTLYPICELTGSKLQDELKAGGYQFSDASRTWMSSTGALLEVQDDGGLMSREEIARLDSGAGGASAVFIIVACGYDTPEAALGGLSSNVKVTKSHVNPDGDVAFAVARNSDKDDYLIAITKTDNAQQTLLVFTEKAVKSGLFAEVTDISSVKSIEGLWKALGVQDSVQDK